jgi:hypothetical protein
MNTKLLATLGFALLAHTSAHAISDKYRQQLERSGCTEVTEAQGLRHPQEQGAERQGRLRQRRTPADTAPAQAQNPYAGQWVAKGTAGATVATIRIDNKENVWVNGKKVKAKRSDGGLVFKQGFITYMIQGDRRLVGEDYWVDSDAGSKGPIVAE